MELDVPVPVELSTQRNSYQFPPPPPNDIRNPNWIPVLHNTTHVDTHRRTFFEKEVVFPPPEEPVPSWIPRPATASSHKYTQSSSAPEALPDFETTAVVPVPKLAQIRTRFNHAEEEYDYGRDDGGALARPGTSANTTTGVMNWASPMVSPVQDERALTPLSASATSAISRSRPSRMVSRASKTSSPVNPPLLRLVHEPHSPKIFNAQPPPPPPPLSPLPPPPPPPKPTPTPSHVLHPTPSALSLGSSSFSDNSPTITTPVLASRHLRLYAYQNSDSGSAEATPRASISVPRPNPSPSYDYAGLASFMKLNEMVVFRRFDDVHLKLMLYLQDLISQLEEELKRLDLCGEINSSSNSTFGAETDERKRECLDKLRDVVGEYDRLISSWQQMHHSKASTSTVEKLRAWLQSHQGSSEGSRYKGDACPVPRAAGTDEMVWTHNANDLSSMIMEKTVAHDPGAAATVDIGGDGVAVDLIRHGDHNNVHRRRRGGFFGFFGSLCGKR